MKGRVQDLLKDRKTLYLILSVVLVSVFSLTIVYAALSVTLNITGNSEVVASSWDIHLENVKVKSGSVSANAPQISGTSSVGFDVELNMPGDYYEFTVDVVNEGSIDAMIDSVLKTPELTTEQAKYIKYEITYENGESISTKQTLKKGTSTPIKVRVEYRKDIVSSDLPSSATELSLKLTLVYVQSDGTGTSINNNGSWIIAADGDINDIGTIVTIGTEQFYTVGIEDDNVKLLSMYNLYVGGSYDTTTKIWTAYGSEATGMQDSTMLGYISGKEICNGITAFSSDTKKGVWHSSYSGSIVEEYVNNYKNIIETNFEIDVVEARPISYDELTSDEIGCDESNYCRNAPQFITETAYWSSNTPNYTKVIWSVNTSGFFYEYNYSTDTKFGVRPVIIVSKYLF